jgi:hypothetical protein
LIATADEIGAASPTGLCPGPFLAWNTDILTLVAHRFDKTGTLCVYGYFSQLYRKTYRFQMAQADDPAKMRNRASRLLDLANRSRCEGRPDYGALLTDLATEILEHARDIEHRHEDEGISPSVSKSNKTSGRDVAQVRKRGERT